jgi:hypothetical protein
MNVAAVTTDTDLPAVIDGCRDLMAIGFGEVSTVDTFERACRKADRKAAARPEDPRLLRARRLLADDVSYERAYAEFMRERPTPEATVDALVHSLRRGIAELTKPDTLRRLSELDKTQIGDVCEHCMRFQPHIAPAWSRDEIVTLIEVWARLRGVRINQ